MVAEPVQATVQALKHYYYQANNYLEDQHDKIINSSYYEKLLELTHPFIYKDLPSENLNYGTNNSISSSISNTWNNLISKLLKPKVKYYGSILTIGLGVTTTMIYLLTQPKLQLQSSIQKNGGKRRVPKLSNGARRDVILIIGSPIEPLTRFIAIDFEKRGFIVYLTLLDNNDIKYIETNLINDRLNYLNFSDLKIIENEIFKFNQILKTPIIPFKNAQSHYLQLKSIIFTPLLHFPIGPIENISINSWIKLNDRILIYLKLFSSGLIQLIRSQQNNCHGNGNSNGNSNGNCKLILLNPIILSGLNIPYHCPETLFQQNLKSIFTILTQELINQNINITQIRLGNLYLSNQNLNSNIRIENLINSEIRTWTSEMKQLYSDNFTQIQFKINPLKSICGGGGGFRRKGTPLIQLYHLLFDLIYNDKLNPNVVYCGTGARIYDWISKILPESWIQWLLK
ncbi:conserved hypothetical protein [Candida dubliniensis CD36]|uniref:DUF1776-domain-containing protein n=1 Tax=Candida dubliniensis (strain CD36 / ATCC MYA-646 / CBS 7987 / NCPF 3949 / NRRL Y-17841) TaxID=573826 RepID=B9WM68_CANDC|nr:conserved hypothetical protein [Candida dubliniensis CD36]CAX40181.1 conserved hypothetical protein [Candida dubliniensis CD36]